MNPVLINDLRKSLFRRRPVLAVALMALAILLLTLGMTVVFPVGTRTTVEGAPLWRFMDLALPVIAPAFAAGAFAREYEQRTWQDLLLTRLSTRQILGGKFFACLLPMLITLIVLFPPFALLLILQDVTWAMEPGLWMVALGIKFLLSATFYLAVTLVCSYHSANFRTALVVGYVTLAAYLLFNYALWTYLLAPLLLTPTWEGAYASGPGGQTLMQFHPAYQTVYSAAYVSSQTFALSPVEWLHLVESSVFSFGLLAYLARRVRRTPGAAAAV
ncbi:MAG TPA: ABC transporter permease subunit [Chthonomonadaceae bacterium]|nr:ABC transporter permease subunit [Chthonomonadaceae bacterium]